MIVNDILQGDSLAVLKTLPSDYVQCVVTSPPYYQLRNYGIDGQIGLEETPAAFVAKLVEVFREVRRVLRPDGVCWLNIGDTYAGGRRGRDDSGTGGKFAGPRIETSQNAIPAGFKPKDLMMIPARVAIALQDDGWYLRSDIIWHKPTAMPESVTDRPTNAHEHVFLLAKSERYYYDAESIKEPSNYPDDNRKARASTEHKSMPTAMIAGIRPGSGIYPYRNKRTVWTVAAQPYAEAHFATMPPKLVEPCILAGTSPKACEHCGTPWKRVTVSTGHVNKREQAHAPYSTPTKTDSTGWAPTRRATDQWLPSCKCANNTGSGKCVVLDCFMGAGTVAMVALQHSRNYLGVELNPTYIELARKRIATVQPTLWSAIGESEVSA